MFGTTGIETRPLRKLSNGLVIIKAITIETNTNLIRGAVFECKGNFEIISKKNMPTIKT